MVLERKSRKKLIPCIRCGVCCSSGVCSHGIEDSYGLCKYLIINQKNTSCQLLIENRIDPKDIGIGFGCILRLNDHVYEYYNAQMKDILEYKKNDRMR